MIQRFSFMGQIDLSEVKLHLADIIAEPLGLVTVKTPLQLPRIDIAQYWHERYHRDPAHQWIRSVIFETFGASSR